MQLADLLTTDRMAVPMAPGDFPGAVAAILGRLEAAGAVEGPSGGDDPLFHLIARGVDSEIVPLQEEAVAVAVRTTRVHELVLGLGVSPAPIPIPPASLEGVGEGKDPVLGARAIFLFLTPRSVAGLRQQAIPALKRILRDPERRERITHAQSTGEVRAFGELMELEMFENLQVSDALVPLVYRVYPDTPMPEVLDLMARKGVSALPVVGPKYEVLGIITAGEALRYLLPRRRAGTGEGKGRSVPDAPGEGLRARDVMSRSVMCVSEDQDLLDAANLMVNRDVAHLPVIREGEIVGFLSRDGALRRLLVP